MTWRVVFDNTTSVSALVFPNSRLAWLLRHWREGACLPLASRETAAELTRVLAYPKFKLFANDRHKLLADYLSYCDVIEVTDTCASIRRDPNDQMFLDLAHTAQADVLVSSDQELLTMAGQTVFQIETPEVYRQRVVESG